ncbi:MAG: hypothetical protein DMG21_08975 [Acidobacteria bacterium]|nr:MAG: hypothetical protein DMG21_08975 [Acidobacteriota bacterium]
MLKISVHNHNHPTTLQLEGRLAGPWVNLAERQWNDLAQRMAPGALIVNLRGLVFADAAGKKLLGRMLREGAEITEARLLVKLIVDELRAQPQAP